MSRRTNNLDNTSSKTKKTRFIHAIFKRFKKDLKIRFMYTYYIISNYFLLRL